MYFKPRIFVSSTLDMPDLRTKIDLLFKSVGAEPLVYEIVMTPSYQKEVYLDYMKIADFAIFILDHKYGKITEKGISGTHEEFNLANSLNIPFHIYINKVDKIKDNEHRKFIEENIFKKNYSFHYYSSQKQLINKIKETIFIISNEIYLSNLEKIELDYFYIIRKSFIHDYNKSLEFIKIIDAIHNRYNNNELIKFDIISQLFWLFNVSYEEKELFVDRNFRNLYDDLYNTSKNFLKIHSSYTVTDRKYTSNKLKLFDIDYEFIKLEPFYDDPKWEDIEKQLNNLLDELFNYFDIFKNAVFVMKQEFDLKEYI
ncbi:MAG: DUF4062 domain-containing protein [Candidatus Kapabacteria bacterium]|nr:DUF4062 domain-containing protein [Candidatus Kapabacteria bacterium]